MHETINRTRQQLQRHNIFDVPRIRGAEPSQPYGCQPLAQMVWKSCRTNVLPIKLVESGIKIVPYKQPPSLKPKITEFQVAISHTTGSCRTVSVSTFYFHIVEITRLASPLQAPASISAYTLDKLILSPQILRQHSLTPDRST